MARSIDDHCRFSSMALGWLLGLRVAPRYHHKLEPPYLNGSDKGVMLAVLHHGITKHGSRSSHGTYLWSPFHQDHGWKSLAWAYNYVGIPTMPVSRGTEGCVKYLVSVLTTPPLLAGLRRLRRIQQEGHSVDDNE